MQIGLPLPFGADEPELVCYHSGFVSPLLLPHGTRMALTLVGRSHGHLGSRALVDDVAPSAAPENCMYGVSETHVATPVTNLPIDIGVNNVLSYNSGTTGLNLAVAMPPQPVTYLSSIDADPI